jgi:serine/threonine protein kinase
MGPSSASMVRELSCNQTPERKYESPKKYALPMVKRLLRHTLLGLEFLHENGIVHGDLNPGNLLFSVSLHGAREEELRQQVELELGTEKRGMRLKDVTNVKVATTLVTTTTAAKEEKNGKNKPKIKPKKLDGSGFRIANGFLRWFKSKRKPSESSKPKKSSKIDKNDKASLVSTVPKYLAVPQSLAKFVDPKNFTVKISDFGGGMYPVSSFSYLKLKDDKSITNHHPSIAFHLTTPPFEKAITPSYLCPPEMILPPTAETNNIPLHQTSTSTPPLPTPKADIWAIGCLIYEFLTGTSLFDLSQGTTPDRLLDLQLVLMEEVIGPMPEGMWRAWGRGGRYFDVDEVEEGDERDGVYELGKAGEVGKADAVDKANDQENRRRCRRRRRRRENITQLGIVGDQSLSLEERFELHKSAELTTEESNQALKVMRWILCYEVQKRPTARELLECEWFNGE